MCFSAYITKPTFNHGFLSETMKLFFQSHFLTLLLFLLLRRGRTVFSCNTTCGSLTVRYPFGTGLGCGSPLFQSSVVCAVDAENGEEQLILKTHTGFYPITSISYDTSTLTISPPLMSSCASMCSSTPALGLDWSTPFQIGPSVFLLLNCRPPTTTTASICDTTRSYLCTLIHTCPTIVSLGLPLFAPTSSCCVYSPANLGPKDELNVRTLRCAAYTSVVSFGDVPMDPMTWDYGVVLRYGGFDEGGVTTGVCRECERSGGVCGYSPPENYFVCACGNGVNSSTSCSGQGKSTVNYLTSSVESALVITRGGLYQWMSVAVLMTMTYIL